MEAYLQKNLKLLRPDGTHKAPQLVYDDALRKALKEALRAKHLVQGLEKIGNQLDKEKKGLDLLKNKSGQVSAPRMSRLILLANDGSERFYHDAESILIRHADRAYGCLVLADSETIGKEIAVKAMPAKAFMIDDRKALGIFLETVVSG